MADENCPLGSRVAAVSAEFDSFLFSTIGEERDGMPLSVLSALARLDVDPWDEAARLAELPREAAARALAAIIAALPKVVGLSLDSTAIAARLVALLPGTVATRVGSPETRPAPLAPAPPATAPARVRLGSVYMVVYLILMVLLIGSQWLEEHSDGAARGVTGGSSVDHAAPGSTPPVAPVSNARTEPPARVP